MFSFVSFGAKQWLLVIFWCSLLETISKPSQVLPVNLYNPIFDDFVYVLKVLSWNVSVYQIYFLSINGTHLKTNIKYVFFFLRRLKLYSINRSHCVSSPESFSALLDTYS